MFPYVKSYCLNFQKKNVGGWGDVEHIFLWDKFKIKVENRSNHSMNNGISLFRKKPGQHLNSNFYWILVSLETFLHLSLIRGE